MADTTATPSATKVVFFGNERLATGVTTTAPTLQALVMAGYDVCAVVSHHSDTRSRNARGLEIAAVAEQHSIPLLQPDKPSEVAEQLQSYGAAIGVLVAYGKIVPQSIIDIFPRGIVNIHPSLLPLHRGPTPLESVILSGETETGVSIMQLAKAMDAGPVYDQTQLRLTGDETKQQLADLLLGHGRNMLIETLPGIIDGSIAPKPQDEALATYDQLIQKQDGQLDFTKPAEELVREIRAYAVWPKSRTAIGGLDVAITDARVIDTPDGDGTSGQTGTIWLDDTTKPKQFGFVTSRGVLVVDKLIPAGKQEMSAAAFLAGYRHLLEL